jgi:hypothetical protein
MTPAEQKAWIAGRDAAAHCVYLARIGEADGDFRCIISNIKALTPPPATDWTPPEDRGDGYECLATVKVVWREWSGEWVYTGEPTAFAPMPEGKT